MKTVVENEGKEEYIHLKSLDNEVEYMESTLPKKETHDSDGQINPNSSTEFREPFDGENESVIYPNLNEDANIEQNRDSEINFANETNFDMVANDDPSYNVPSGFENDNLSMENVNDTSSLHDLKKTLFQNT